MSDSNSLNYTTRRLFGEFLDLEGLTEIAVNRPGELFTKIRGQWERHKVPLTLDDCEKFSRLLATYHGEYISDIKPILSATLNTGERCQVIIPPACQRDTVSITLRKPSTVQIPHQSYIDNGFYDRVQGKVQEESHNAELLRLYKERNIPKFIEKCMEYGKTMVFCGETGSGKTTYLKTLIDYIPLHLRITTIEDNPEVFFKQHKNYVNLFYPSEVGNSSKAIVTPGALVRANYRMNPDRILITEVRGGEAWEFIKIVGSGHEGCVTSVHAGSPYEAIQGLVDRCFQNTECSNLPYSVLLSKVLNSVDVVASIQLEGDVRHMGDIYFREADKAEYMRRFRDEIF
ncbi:P-type DNA transfer ATPase VirB11 [Serratia marcescens]|uniref:P-type DNA transfer ATPase VirB11 n=1 Tax=Serratia marcescens TaxID=615 RepID=UPI0011B9C999|nr:P-type DNA transfer ATPase VirB11 [Serratia marcescens]TWY26219.1 P-type DNA transfer ATPase VirB11 [Serratia marcescens]TWY31451.1 P-type DNA transfer ATPase VirB11 [Serratia marcescens]TYR78055.1 P-type DNA transfer ATPase VirB11 [Serratia marcescens]